MVAGLLCLGGASAGLLEGDNPKAHGDLALYAKDLAVQTERCAAGRAPSYKNFVSESQAAALRAPCAHLSPLDASRFDAALEGSVRAFASAARWRVCAARVRERVAV